MINQKTENLCNCKRTASLYAMQKLSTLLYIDTKEKQSNLIRYSINESKIEVKNKGHPTWILNKK